MTEQKIPLAGVIGAPIAHSRSPQLHRHWLQTYGLKGFYVPLEVSPMNLKEVLRTLPKAGFVGVNITIPHKEAVLEIVDSSTQRARQIGAANTLVFKSDGTIHADNTDGYGFLENLRSGAPNWRAAEGPAVILGAGGAARSVIVSLLEAGVPRILLTNRTRSRAEKLRTEFGNRIEIVDWDQAPDVLGQAALVVNTSSLGMVGQPDLSISLEALSQRAVVTDLVYTPLKTNLLVEADRKGCTTVDGLGMLLHQGVPGFESWFGLRPAVTEATRAAVLA